MCIHLLCLRDRLVAVAASLQVPALGRQLRIRRPPVPHVARLPSLRPCRQRRAGTGAGEERQVGGWLRFPRSRRKAPPPPFSHLRSGNRPWPWPRGPHTTTHPPSHQTHTWYRLALGEHVGKVRRPPWCRAAVVHLMAGLVWDLPRQSRQGREEAVRVSGGGTMRWSPPSSSSARGLPACRSRPAAAQGTFVQGGDAALSPARPGLRKPQGRWPVPKGMVVVVGWSVALVLCGRAVVRLRGRPWSVGACAGEGRRGL